MADPFCKTTKVKTTQVAHIRGQRCGDIELTDYLTDVVGSVNLVRDLCLTHERFGSSSK